MVMGCITWEGLKSMISFFHDVQIRAKKFLFGLFVFDVRRLGKAALLQAWRTNLGHMQ